MNSRIKRIVGRRLLLTTAAIGIGVLLARLDGHAVDRSLSEQLKRLFPAAASFSPKGGSPPHFKALGKDAHGGEVVLGYAFWTTELEPLERGYDGPIRILVGLNANATLAAIVVAQHREPYGDFSIEPPEFAAQFKGKRLTDPFRVGTDIDAVSRATITVTSATRAVRNSARRFARQLPETAR